jgi:hypothetical protein
VWGWRVHSMVGLRTTTAIWIRAGSGPGTSTWWGLWLLLPKLKARARVGLVFGLSLQSRPQARKPGQARKTLSLQYNPWAWLGRAHILQARPGPDLNCHLNVTDLCWHDPLPRPRVEEINRFISRLFEQPIIKSGSWLGLTTQRNFSTAIAWKQNIAGLPDGIFSICKKMYVGPWNENVDAPFKKDFNRKLNNYYVTNKPGLTLDKVLFTRNFFLSLKFWALLFKLTTLLSIKFLRKKLFI